MRNKGFTLLESLLAVAILAIVIMALAYAVPQTMDFIRQYQVRSQQTREGRILMDTITRTLEKAIPSSLVICNSGACLCGGGALGGGACTPPSYSPQYSHIEFNLSGGATTYMFYWNNYQAGMEWKTPAIATAYGPQILANNITYVSFQTDPRDPGVVIVGLQMDVAKDGHSNPYAAGQQDYTLIMPSENVRPQGTLTP